MTQYLNADDVAAQLKCDRVTVLRKAKLNEIGCIRDGRIVRFKQAHVDAYVAAHEEPAKPRQVPAPYGGYRR